MRNALLDDPKVASLVFYPRKTPKPDMSELGEGISTLEVNVNHEITLGCMVFSLSQSSPTMILFHGNGELALDYTYFADGYLKCGVNLVVVDFRGYGFSTGSPTLGSLFDDALPAYNGVRDELLRQEYADEFFVFGRSLGSIPACEIGAKNPQGLKGIVLESAIARTLELLENLFNISLENQVKDQFTQWSNIARLKKFSAPTLILHGTADSIVPYEHSSCSLEAIPESTYKKRVTINGAGHNDMLMHSQVYFPPIKAHVEKFK